MRTLLLFVACIGFVQAQGSGVTDTVKYRDRTKDGLETIKLGELKESAAGIVITSGGKAITISPADVISVQYGKLVGVEDRVRMEMPSWETKGGSHARDNYAKVLQDLENGDERTRRFLEYKVASWSARVADTKTGKEFASEAASAVEKLLLVSRAYPQSWEQWPAARTAARLQMELGKPVEAAATLSALAKSPNLPAEFKHEAKLGEIDVLYRSGSSAAGPTIDALAKASDLTPVQKERLAIYRAAVQGADYKSDATRVDAAAKAIRERINAAGDTSTKATAHNALGELFLQARRPRDAMWEFLWVEAVHNTDREELLKALTRLGEIFEQQGDSERAATYREKVLRVKAL